MSEENDPEQPTIWKEARNYVDQGSYDKAIEIYKYLLIRFGENSIVVELANANLGDVYLTLNQAELAESHLKKAIKRNSKKPAYHYLLGFAFSKQTRWVEAVHEFEWSIKTEPDNAEFLRGLGWAQVNGGDKVKGKKNLERALEIAPRDVNILLDLANVYLFEQDFEEAKRYAQGAVLLEPENAWAKKVFDKICHFEKEFKRNL
jgi:tetratricopeptide (TPR) repeat protein